MAFELIDPVANYIEQAVRLHSWNTTLQALRTLYIQQHPLTPDHIYRVHNAIEALREISSRYCPSAPGFCPIGDNNGPQSETP